MKRGARASRYLGLLFLLATSPAIACLPPPPGAPEIAPPTNEHLAQLISESSTDFAYGVVIGETGYAADFKVIHVYRGRLIPGQIIQPAASWGFSGHPCPGMVPPPPAFQGAYGVIAYEGEPKLSFVPDDVLQQMFAAGLIVSAKAPRSR